MLLDSDDQAVLDTAMKMSVQTVRPTIWAQAVVAAIKSPGVDGHPRLTDQSVRVADKVLAAFDERFVNTEENEV